MLNVTKTTDNGILTISAAGRIDTTTALDFENEIKDSLSGVSELVLDFGKVEYISSAGLRVLLSAQKIMTKQGSMKLTNVSAEIMEIFEVTGFSDILDIS